MKYDRVLVTGGAGFIGSHTVEALLDSDVKTWILDDLSSGYLRNLIDVIHNPRLHFVRGSITDYRSVHKLARKVDAIIHLAAQISPFISMKYPENTTTTNVNGTLNVLRAAAKEKLEKVVFASSSSVYGDFNSRYVSEKLPTNPISPYGASKLAAEKYCGAFYRAYNLPTISLRYLNVYGQRQSSNPYSGVIAIFTKALIHRRRPIIFGDGNQTRDFIHVSDVARANIIALQSRSGYGDAFNVGTGKAITINHLADLLRAITGRKEIQPAHKKSRPGDIRDSCADITKTRFTLHFKSRIDLKTGLTLLVNSLR